MSSLNNLKKVATRLLLLGLLVLYPFIANLQLLRFSSVSGFHSAYLENKEEFEYLNELQVAAEKLIQSYGFRDIVTLFLKWVVSFAAMLVIFSCLV